MRIYNGFFRALRLLARPFTFLHKRPSLKGLPDPCVFICRHRNLRGPIFTMLHMNRQLRPWVFNVFCEKESCYRQYSSYTFSVRLKWDRARVESVARLGSRFVPFLMRSMGAIPVYRDMKRMRQTFNLSLQALLRGESIIIYPDVDYVDTSDTPGAMYTGYLMLGQMYYKATGKNLSFVPTDIRMKRRAILLGDPVEFDGAVKFGLARGRCAAEIQTELEKLGEMV